MSTVVIPRIRSRSGSLSRRLALALGATALATVALLAAAGTASANDVTCTGFTRLDKTVPSDHKVVYRFRCTDAIAGYTIFSIDEVSAFDPEGVVEDPLTLQGVNGESYSCEGVLPGHGEVCNGKASRANVVTAAINTDALPCTATSNFFLAISDAKGAPSGLFTLGRPRGCPALVHARRLNRKGVRRTRR
jgi:hypothetical protein